MSPKIATVEPARWQPTGLVTTLLSPGARQVINCWLGTGDFLDEQHQPRILLALAEGDDAFTDLVRCANPDLVSAVVLNELLRKGIVEALESGHVLLKRSAYAPAGQPEPESVLAEPEDLFSNGIPRRRFNDT